MPDDQITAIYLKHQQDGEAPDHEEVEAETLEVEFPIVDIPVAPQGARGPHWNEDDFPIY